LLNITNICVGLLFAYFFLGCSKVIYASKYYKPYNKKYQDIEYGNIKNSKAMHRATMKSYVVAGKRYYPTLAKVGDRLDGIASWYGPNFHAKLTSNGEIYNMHGMTAAHKTLPMNTVVEVLNLENKKSVVVRINDRGPFVTGRIIDLSNAAAHQIDMVKKGTAKVKVTILGFNAKIAKTRSQKAQIATLNTFYVQVGAFTNLDGAKSTKRKFNLILEDRYKAIIKQSGLNRVWISGFRSEDEAIDFKMNNNLKSAMIIAQ